MAEIEKLRGTIKVVNFFGGGGSYCNFDRSGSNVFFRDVGFGA